MQLPNVTSSDEVKLNVPIRPPLRRLFRCDASGRRRLDWKWAQLFAPQIMLLSYLVIVPCIVGSRGGWQFSLFSTALILGTLLMTWASNTQIRYLLRPTHIHLSISMFGRLISRGRKRKLTELRSVRFVKADRLPFARAMYTGGYHDSLVLDWKETLLLSALSKEADTQYIPISNLNDDERRQLFVYLSRHVPQEILSPEVLFMQLQVLSGQNEVNIDNYTNIWLEEFNRKFEISNYLTLHPGTRCGNERFQITMVIANRINTASYLGVDAQGNHVVVKELIAPLDSDDAAQKKLLEQFNREASLLASLNHPGIVKIVDHFIENNRSYIVMECVHGKNLREFVRLNGTMSEREVVAIAKQLVGVLQHLHSREPAILHRDFTPDNLLYKEDGSIVVIDFGAANVFTAGKTATLIGKQSYMPPEQLQGKPCPASDVYALGATLYFLLSGKDLPSMGSAPQVDGVSPELTRLISRCLSFDSVDRASLSEVASALEALPGTAALEVRA
jgi:serine/threonine protein kinase